MTWKTIDRPGQFGKKREGLQLFWDSEYGIGNWRVAYVWGDNVITRSMAIQIYEDSYYEFFKSNTDELDWLITNACDIYDTAPTNVQAGLSYDKQETPNSHIHDISIRRAILRLGHWFKGERLIHVRWTGTEGYKINPGVVPFHLPKMIATPKLEGWWYPDTIEDFYQSNKVIQIKE